MLALPFVLSTPPCNSTQCSDWIDSVPAEAGMTVCWDGDYCLEATKANGGWCNGTGRKTCVLAAPPSPPLPPSPPPIKTYVGVWGNDWPTCTGYMETWVGDCMCSDGPYCAQLPNALSWCLNDDQGSEKCDVLMAALNRSGTVAPSRRRRADDDPCPHRALRHRIAGEGVGEGGWERPRRRQHYERGGVTK